MRLLKDEKGIALVTSLMLTMLTLTISMVMLYMVQQNLQVTGTHKRYKNSLDAAVGGVEIVTMDAIPYLLGFALDPNASSLVSRLNTSMSLAAASGVTDLCLATKLTQKNWGAACDTSSTTLDPKTSPDLTFTLQSQLPGALPGYRVYTKIVSTTVGSTDLSGRDLEGQPTYGAPLIDVGSPYLYRIEVTSERVSNPLEKASLSVLYAY